MVYNYVRKTTDTIWETGADLNVNNLNKDLMVFAGKVPLKAQEIISEVAKDYAADLLRNVPISGRPASEKNNFVNLKDDLKIERMKKNELIPTQRVGFGVKAGWTAHFSNSGTIYQKPTGWIKDTNKDMQDKTEKAIGDGLKRWLENGGN